MRLYDLKFYWLFTISLSMLLATHALAEEKTMTLVNATMCESIEKFLPVYPAVVFSISQGEIICFTTFDSIPEKTHVFHKWYKRDQLISQAKLTLNPPKWSSFSSMQLRNVDKGPWRVDITDANETIMKTLRFSISD